MLHYPYLIVGGGMTAAAAIGGIREVDSDGAIGLIGAESYPPYNRPPLSKGLWKGAPMEKVWRKIDGRG
jgi:NADPH-dependent 2,4-dienoyl-CoA reductase/sulfur reductase-like enzyme